MLTAAAPVIATSGPWTLGVLIGIPLCIAAVIASIALAIWLEDKILLGGIPIALVIAGVILFPFNSAYLQYRSVDGTVATVDSRLVQTGSGDSRSINERYVVVFEGSDQQFGIDDTRAAAIEPGENITIACIKEWQYAATDGYVCRWSGGGA